MNQSVCVVVGVGPGNGASFARAFAREGYRLALVARHEEYSRTLADEIGGASVYHCDVGDQAQVGRTFAAIARDLGDPDVVIYNAGRGVWGTLEEIEPEGFEQSWRVNAWGAFLVAREVAGPMKARGHGCFIFVGATASWRGRPKTAAFASAKAAQRSLAQSMARDLGPHGVHVAVIIPDGTIARPESEEEKQRPGNIDPDAVAETALFLARQPPSAWSFEVDVRPYAEPW